MTDWLSWIHGDAAEIADALGKDWRDRGALTAKDAFGDTDSDTTANKGVARAHKDGAMNRFASEATMRHFKTVGLVDGLKVRNVKPTGETERGMMRLWSIADVLKAETALVFAEFADFPARNVARLLHELPFTDSAGLTLLDSYADTWANHAFVTLGQEAGDAETQAEAQAYFRDNPEAAEDASRNRDPKLIIADRKWVFGANLSATGTDLEPFLIAEMKTFRTGKYGVPPISVFKRDIKIEIGFAPDISRRHAPGSKSLLDHASVVIELNLFEPMRRFIHRNRKGDTPMR